MTNDKALNAYIARVQEAAEALAQLQSYIDDHGDVTPEDVNWQHVGSMSQLAADINQLTDRIYKRGEYA